MTDKRYDYRGNLIYIKSSYFGYEAWREYDENDRLIHYKNTFDKEGWYKYNEYGKCIKITKQEYKKIKEKEYLSRKKVSRFELMEI